MAISKVVIHLPKSANTRLEEGKDYFYAEDYLKASKQFTKLINEGVDEAYHFMGCIYELGGKGIKQDLTKSVFYYSKAAELGHAQGFYGLGRLFYYGGEGFDRDFKEAFDIYTDLNESTCYKSPVAKLMLGKLYASGQGIDKNLVIAKQYFIDSYRLGNIFALMHLAFLEKKYGNYIKGVWMHLKFIFIYLWIHTFDADNPRLRDC